MAQVVAEKGYAATTVADVVERAGVSRRTFYEQFADKEACFLAAYDVGLAVVLGPDPRGGRSAPGGRVAGAGPGRRGGLPRPPGLGAGLRPGAAGRDPHRRPRRPGPPGRDAGDVRRRSGATSTRPARAEEPALPSLPDEVFTVLTAGLEELVRDCIRTRGTAALPELAEPIVRTVFAVFGGGPPA